MTSLEPPGGGGHANHGFNEDDGELSMPQSPEPEDMNIAPEFPQSSPIPEEFQYEMPKDEVKSWDQFTQNEFAQGSASEKHTNLIKKAAILLKCVTIVVTFTAVIVGGVVSKGMVFFMLAQVKMPVNDAERLKSCITAGIPPNKTHEYIDFGEKESVPWKWCLFFCFAVPEAMAFFRALRVCLQKTVNRPKLIDFLIVIATETIHVSGLAILYLVALPNLDSVRAIMVTSGTCLLPSFLKTLKDLGRRDKPKTRLAMVILDGLAVLVQIIGLFIWPLATTNNSSNFVWSFILGLLMTSFGWWESFVDEHSMDPVSKYLWRLKTSMQENKTRYFVYIWISLWKIVLFFALFVGLDAAFYSVPTSNQNRAADLFKDFDFSGTGYRRASTFDNGTDQTNLEIDIAPDDYTPAKVLLIQLGCAYGAYIFGKFACKVNIQIEAFALPMLLVGPATVCGVITMCHYRAADPCSLGPTIPDHIFYQCPKLPELMGTSGLHGWVWVIWALSVMWISGHIWRPKSKRLASTEQMFGTPYYCGLMIDNSMMLNRRSDKGASGYRLDFASDQATTPRTSDQSSKHPEETLSNGGGKLSRQSSDTDTTTGETLPRWKRMLPRGPGGNRLESLSTTDFREEDERTRIMGCATMWHESSDEMTEMIKSIFRIDEDYSARFLARSILDVNDPDFYEWETHIFFDDAFRLEGKHFVVNSFVRLLVEKMDEQGKKWYGRRNMKVPYPIRYATPYGGRLIWKLPGNTKIICHLKDKNKIRHKKRWSQIMYMYYFLGHKLVDNVNLSERQKQARKRNTYLLALDGDVDFQPDAIIKLVDLMKRNPKIGASCGRIHPTGSGFMQWYQMFEYAIGHWLQKSTEHILGCVLCSPGCFSLFRAEAVMDENVMRTYTTLPTEPRHHVQYDQGEDRWLCTLLLQQGWRVEYSAASDSFTACPEGFKEFYNQRRRWMPSTLANIMDLLSDYKRVIKNNDDISFFYIIYQIMLMVGTCLGPGSIMLMLSGAFSIAFGLTDTEAFIANSLPVIAFIVICFTCKSDIQLAVAEFLSVVYALVMVAMVIGIIISASEDGGSAPTSLSLIYTVFIFLLAGILHPQEANCLPMGVIYLLTIPSMYLLLVIYSVFNLNNVSWGTREVPKTAAELEKEREEAQKEAELKVLKRKKSKSIFNLFGGSDAGIVSNLFNKNQNDQDVLKAELKVISAKLETIETKLDIGKPKENLADKGATKPTMLPKPAVPTKPIKRTLTVRIHEPTVDEDEEIQVRDDLRNPYWIEQESHIGTGPQRYLKKKEVIFWQEMIEKYLKPLDKDKEKEKRDAQGLTELRNSAVFSFLMLNSIWVVALFLMQMHKDSLSIRWPIPKTTNKISYDSDVNIVVVDEEYQYVEPLGLLFVIFFALVMFFQLIGMVMHRIMTLGHIVSTTNIGITRIWKRNDQFDPDKMLNDEGVKMIKELQKILPYDEAEDCANFEEVVEKALENLAVNDDALRKFSNKFGPRGSRGSDGSMQRTKTVRDALNRRASVYAERKKTMKFKSKPDRIDEEPDYLSPDMPGGPPDRSLQMSTQPFKVAVERTKSKVDPEGKEDNDC